MTSHVICRKSLRTLRRFDVILCCLAGLSIYLIMAAFFATIWFSFNFEYCIKNRYWILYDKLTSLIIYRTSLRTLRRFDVIFVLPGRTLNLFDYDCLLCDNLLLLHDYSSFDWISNIIHEYLRTKISSHVIARNFWELWDDLM